MSDKIIKSDAEWREQLSADEYHVARERGTERAFTGRYWDHHADGVYTCVGCGAPLFDAETASEAARARDAAARFRNLELAGRQGRFSYVFADRAMEEGIAAARRILGLDDGASEDDIRAAYHRLIALVHPDRGGSGFLAAQVNRARDVLLRRARRS